MAEKKILLAHLNSNGDCLFATVIARQIKEIDYPGCHLTWAVSNRCKQSIALNPYVDEIWEVPTSLSLATEKEWNDFVEQAEQLKSEGRFNLIFYTQLIGKNAINFDGGIRSSTYNNYPGKVTVSQQPVLRLSETEVHRVKAFAVQHRLAHFTQVILVECGPESFKSSLNPASMLVWAQAMLASRPGLAIILSSNKIIATDNPAIIDGSVLTFRENAELTKYCSLFIGCSSGISWLGTTDWAKPLPRIIVTRYKHWLFSSMVYDHVYAGLPVNDIIELDDNKNVIARLTDCANAILHSSFQEAKERYHQPFKIKNYSFIYRVCRDSFKRLEFVNPLRVLERSNKRNGFDIRAVLNIGKAYIKMPFQLMVIAIQAIVKNKNTSGKKNLSK